MDLVCTEVHLLLFAAILFPIHIEFRKDRNSIKFQLSEYGDKLQEINYLKLL
jgi:hypothetical protein